MYRLKLEELAEEINRIEDNEVDYQKNKRWIRARKIQDAIYDKMKDEEMERWEKKQRA